MDGSGKVEMMLFAGLEYLTSLTNLMLVVSPGTMKSFSVRDYSSLVSRVILRGSTL
jgi:hypothetical protein